MVTYARDEIISVSEAVRGFSNILKDLKEHTKEKYAVMKNNKLVAVIS